MKKAIATSIEKDPLVTHVVEALNNLMDEEMKSVEDIKYINDGENKDERYETLYAIILQNYYHDRNSDRSKAIAEGKWVDIKSNKDAKRYLSELLKKHLVEKLKKSEKEQLDKFRDSSANLTARKFLLAPDHVYAAAIMKAEKMYIGRGDITKIFEILHDKKAADFLDIGRKLALLKTGCLLKKGLQINIDETSSTCPGIVFKSQAEIDSIPESDKFVVYNDTQRFFRQKPISHKLVFKVWAT